MFYESYFVIDNECYFMAHSNLMVNRLTLLFIHGLGDSHINYLPYLNSSLTEQYNVLVPDLLGYGKSSRARDYCFSHQVIGLEKHISYLQKTTNIRLSDFILIAHSMGGIHATLLCASSFKESIKAFINVEGSVTQFGSFISADMVHSLKIESFTMWWMRYKKKIMDDMIKSPYFYIRSYYAGLEFCDQLAFLQNATEMYEMSRALSGKYTSIVGQQYSSLTIPRIYCYGDVMCKETIEFLNGQHLSSRHFSCSHHFLLSECVEEYVTFIDDYIKNLS